MALYDHPLTGSAITLLGLLMAPPRGWGSIYRLVMLAALIGFGGRAALLIGLCALALLSLIAAHENPRPRALPPSVKIMAQLLGLLIFAGVFTVLSGAGTRLLAHLSWDSSAQARLWSWGILASLDAREIILGTSHADVIRHLQAIQLENGGMVVENFWIMMLITLGMCGFSLFLAGFWMLNRWLWRFTTARGKVILVALLLILSTNNSLARKSSILTITAFVVCARPIYVRAPRRQFAPAIAAANG